MSDIILTAVGYALIIVVGFICRQVRLVDGSAGRILSAIMLTITLPCVVIVNLNGQELPLALLSLSGIAILYNVVLLGAGWLLGRSERPAFSIIAVSGFNIGCFAIPFVSGFFSPAAMIATSMFDLGNSIMCLGANFGVAKSAQGTQAYPSKRSALVSNTKTIVASVVKSAAVITYVTMAVLCLLHVSLPEAIMGPIRVGANANAFLAMMTIGVSICLPTKEGQLACVGKHLLARFITCGALAAASLLLPFSSEIRMVLATCCFAPMSSSTVAYTIKLGEDDGMTACINSFSIPLSLAGMTAVVALLGA